MGKSCKDLISNINDYIDGEIGPELCDEIERHVGRCSNCKIMVDTMRKTVRLCCEGREVEIPRSLEDRLYDLLKKRWKSKFDKE